MDLLSNGAIGALIYAAPVAGAIFLVIRGLAGPRNRNDLPTPPPVPPGAYVSGDRGADAVTGAGELG